MQRIVAVVGLSGVGKTTALLKLLELRSFQHLRAGRLISDGRNLEKTSTSLDSLRHADIDENQRLLIAGFRHAINLNESYVVLDGHTLIETPSGSVPISGEVFEQLRIEEFIFIADDPAKIVQRRLEDTSRARPPATEAVVAHIQEIALLTAFRISAKLRIPLSTVAPTDTRRLERLVFDQ